MTSLFVPRAQGQLLKVILVIDADNIFYSFPPEKRYEGYRIDYQPLVTLAERSGLVVDRACYVSSLPGKNDGFIYTMEADEWRMVTLPLHTLPDGRKKSPLDTRITMDIWEAALNREFHNLIFVTGDSDFVPLVGGLVRRGHGVMVIGPEGSTAVSLIDAATSFRWLGEVEGVITRERFRKLPFAA